MSADVKDALYLAIKQMGRERIRTGAAANVDACETYCREIFDRCASILGSMDDNALATMCEALLHFMLTASVLPSERKIRMNGADLDLVVPSTRMLAKNPSSSLVIQVVRYDLAEKVKHAKSVQPHSENIWLISAKPLQTDYRNYHLGQGNHQYARIVSDINAFLTEKGDRGLKLLHGQ